MPNYMHTNGFPLGMCTYMQHAHGNRATRKYTQTQKHLQCLMDETSYNSGRVKIGGITIEKKINKHCTI